MTGLLLRANGSIAEITFNTSSIAKTVHDLVNGYFQVIPQSFNSRVTMYANEDGKRDNLPINFLATILSGLWPHDLVVGDVVLVGAPDEQGDDQGLPPEVIQAVCSIDIQQSWKKLTDEEGHITR